MELVQIEDRLDKDFPGLGVGYVSCGIGWYLILRKLIQRVISLDPDISILQIKEKFGEIQFYVNSASPEVNNVISDFAVLSGTVCESCGTKDDVTMEGEWVKAFCPECRIDNIV